MADTFQNIEGSYCLIVYLYCFKQNIFVLTNMGEGQHRSVYNWSSVGSLREALSLTLYIRYTYY